MIGIYQILNTKNNKSYIGQSRNIERRIKNHKRDILNDSHTIEKIDYNNLKFLVLEECEIKDLNHLEKKWVKIFNSFESGYNKTEGGGATPDLWSKSYERSKRIQSLLLNTDLTIIEIANIESVHYSTVSRINSGETNVNEDLNYPIREIVVSLYDGPGTATNPLCLDCGIGISHGSKRCTKCNGEFNRIISKPNKEDLLEILLEEQNFKEVGRIFNTSDNVVRSWCRSYDLPDKTNAYKEKIEKRSITLGKVNQIDIETNEIIATYKSAMDAARSLGNEDYNKHISSVCTGRRKSAYGYRWVRI